MREISARERELPEAVIGKLLKIAVEDKSIVSLGPGEPDFATPKPILKHAKKVINKSTHYSPTQGIRGLRELIANKLRKKNRINADPKDIIVTCGSQQALFTGLSCTLDPSEQVIVPNPGYVAYVPETELITATPVYVKLVEEENFELNPCRIEEVIDKKKTNAIIINTPNNPTGAVYSKKVLEEIADIAVDYDLYIFADEAYENIIYDKKHVSIGSLNGMEDYVITLQSFSKSYAMCGFRVGYAHGPSDVIKAMEKASHYITLSPPNISQLLAMKALTISDRYIKKMVKEYRRRRNFLVKRLNELGMPTIMPEGAFYTFSNIKDYSKNSFKFSDTLLKKAKVAVMPGSEFGKYGEGYIRCSYATDLKLIKEAMNRVEKFLKKSK